MPFFKSSSQSLSNIVCRALATLILTLISYSSAAQANEPVESDRPISSTCQVNTATWQKSVTTIQAFPGHEWRKTSEGWMQIPLHPVPVMHNLELPSYQPAIHPLNVATMIFLLSLLAMAWGSSEWDWDRFVNA